MTKFKVHNKLHLTDQQLASACLTFNHSFGLRTEEQQKSLLAMARSWEDAFHKELEKPRD
jgi:hypothetical protein